MKSEYTVMLVLILMAIIVGGGLLWLSRGSGMPPVQKTEQVIPDDRIPR